MEKTVKLKNGTIIDTYAMKLIGRECIICGETIILDGPYDTRTICPECLYRLKETLYPERCN